MSNSSTTYDAVVIGSGLGGLVSAAILSKEGWRVCVLEKNEQIGGSLQTFRRDGVLFDTGVHYIGGLEPGENLYQIFNYLGIMDRLLLKRMDEMGFDVILFGNDDEQYPYGMGYKNFVDVLSEKFPDDVDAIKQYAADMRNICNNFPLYNLKASGEYQEKWVFTTGIVEYLQKLTTNQKLQHVLAGNNLVYAGVPAKTPVYVHALVVNSYIESSNKCTEGGDQIAKLLARVIKENGGDIFRKAEVKSINVEEGVAQSVTTANGNIYYGRYFISNAHPVRTMQITDTTAIRSVYRNRLKSLENSIAAFVVYMVLKPQTYKYTNRNYYYFDEVDAWRCNEYTEEIWPYTYALFEGESDKHPGYAESATVITYMRFDDVKEWAETYNTRFDENSRGESYNEFKKRKEDKLMETVYRKFPHLKDCIASTYTSTPLTYRDYIGSDDGSMYGILKDFNDPIKSMVAPKTKVDNLLLTGQNINLHGVLGVTVSAVITCSMILGREYLIGKILKANEATV